MDNYKVADPDDFELFAIREATELEITDDERMALYEMDSAELPNDSIGRAAK